MIVQCAGCQTRFKIPDEKLSSGSVKVRCSRCGMLFPVQRPAASGPALAAAPPPPPSSTPAIKLQPLAAPARSSGGLESRPTWAATGPTASSPSGTGAGLLGDSDPFAHLDLSKIPVEPEIRIGGQVAAPDGPPPLDEGPLIGAVGAKAGPATAVPTTAARTKPQSSASIDDSLMPPGSGPDMSLAIDLGGDESQGFEFESFGGSGYSPAPPSSPARPPASSARSAMPAARGEPEPRPALGAAEEGELELEQVPPRAAATPAPSQSTLPKAATPRAASRAAMPAAAAPAERKGSDSRSPLPAVGQPTPLPAPAEGELARHPATPAQLATALPLSRAAVQPALAIRPPIGNTLLLILLGLLVAVDLLAVFVLSRNGWRVDLRSPGRVLAVALGQQAPELWLGEGPTRLSNLHPLLYTTAGGKTHLIVEGEVANVSQQPLRLVRITLNVVEARSGRMLERREVPGGGRLEPGQLARLETKAEVDQAFLELDRQHENTLLRPGMRAPFLAVFTELPGGLDALKRLTVEARVSSLREAVVSHGS